MCIIAYSADKSISIETLKNCFENNPNGAGIMYKKDFNDDVHIVKGLMTFEELKTEYDKIPDKSEVAVHCRIATSGAIGAATCHPFPVVGSIEKMKKPKMKTEMALMHNGVISFCTPKNGMKESYSDSMLFTKQFIEPLKYRLDKAYIQSLIEESTNSRFCIMRKGKVTLLLGTWVEHEKNQYSNSTYKKTIQYYYEYQGKKYPYASTYYNGYGEEYEGYQRPLNVLPIKERKKKQLWEIELVPPEEDLESVYDQVEGIRVAENVEGLTEDAIFQAIDYDISEIENALLESGIRVLKIEYESAPFYTVLITEDNPTQICESLQDSLYTEVSVCKQN